jgi:hypothetical protein
VIKVVMAIRRRDDVAPEEFHRYWLEEHGHWLAGCSSP